MKAIVPVGGVIGFVFGSHFRVKRGPVFLVVPLVGAIGCFLSEYRCLLPDVGHTCVLVFLYVNKQFF